MTDARLECSTFMHGAHLDIGKRSVFRVPLDWGRGDWWILTFWVETSVRVLVKSLITITNIVGSGYTMEDYSCGHVPFV